MRTLPLLLVPSLAFADPAPPVEVRAVDVAPKLPPVPEFAVPVGSPKELQLVTRPLDTKVKVTGFIVGMYSCKTLDTDPTLCERPKFYLGSTRATRKEAALWVVDVPRPPTKLERERLPKDELAKWPAVPQLAVGDYVTVTGTFALASAHSESNSDGLVVFESVQKQTPPGKVKVVAVGDEPKAPLDAIQLPKQAPVDAATHDAAAKELIAGNKLLAQRDADKAIEAYQRALQISPTNHLAHYGLGGAYAMKFDYAKAREQFAAAVALAPDAAMYQLWLGVAMFEEANKAHGDLTKAREPLRRALDAEPRLWRAAYYLGRISRETGHPHAAAAAFTQAIENNPREASPFIALAELYRHWGMYPQALQVANEGVTDATDRGGDLTFILGRIYEETAAPDKAIAAFSKAIDAGNKWALYERAQTRRAKGDKAGAKQDFEAFVASGKDGEQMQLAKQALVDLK